MESLTILTLNDDCLNKIVSFIDDFPSFYSFASTCKRFQRLTSSNPLAWNLEVLKRNAEYYAKAFIVNNSRFDIEDGNEKFLELLELFKTSSKSSISPEQLLQEAIGVWKSNGPVVAKLFTWVKRFQEEKFEDSPRVETSVTERNVAFHLSKCSKELSINNSVYIAHAGNYDCQIEMKITCGEVQIEETIFVKLSAHNYREFSEAEMQRITQPFESIISLFQDELGETTPSITNAFFVWLCFFFLSKPEVELKDEDKLLFTDSTKNQIPTFELVQELYIKPEDFHKSGEKWRIETEQLPYSKILSMSLTTLVTRKAKNILDKIHTGTVVFYNILTTYDFRKFSKEMMVELITRTTILSNRETIATEKKVLTLAQFMLRGRKMMNIEATLQGDFGNYQLSMVFEWPEHGSLQIAETVENNELDDDVRELFVEKFTPLTGLLKQCIETSMKDSTPPKITNIFTVIYFMWVLGIDEAINSFLGYFYDIVENCDNKDD